MNPLSKSMLAEVGAYTPAKPEQKQITWNTTGEDGRTITHGPYDIWVRHRSVATANAETRAYYQGDDLMGARIASSILDENGEQMFTIEHVMGNHTLPKFKPGKNYPKGFRIQARDRVYTAKEDLNGPDEFDAAYWERGEDIHGPMCDSLATALLVAIGEVNGGSAKKNSTPTPSSGASLSSPASAVKPSPKRRQTSVKPKP